MPQLYDDPAFLREEWALYALGALVILVRFAVRLRTVGLRGFQGDDYMAILVLAFFTMDAATVYIIYYAGTNVEAAVIQKTRVLTAEEIAAFTHGSQEELAAWYSYTALIWCMKGQMLFFFHRLTMGLNQQKLVKWIGVACGISYLVVVLTLTFGCFPTQKNWQVVPDPGSRCTLKLQNFLVTVVLNVCTDAAILSIPLPLLWKLKVELRKKIVIFILLSSGVFVITAAIIRVVLTLGAHPSALNMNRWGVRETIIGIIAINVPILRSLFNRSFWTGAVYDSGNNSYGTSNTNKGANLSCGLSSKARAHMGNSNKSSACQSGESFVRLDEEDSLELIMQNNLQGVHVHTSYAVMMEDVEQTAGMNNWNYGPGHANKTTVHVQTSAEQMRQGNSLEKGRQ